MIRGETHSVSLGVMGDEGLVETVAESGTETSKSLEVVEIEPVSDADDSVVVDGTDCLVVDASATAVEGRTAVERWRTERADEPVVLLVDDWDAERVTEALAAGTTQALPRRLVETEPELFVDRVTSVVDRTQGWASFGELYDNVAGIVTLHDPESEGALPFWSSPRPGAAVLGRQRRRRTPVAGFVSYCPPEGGGSFPSLKH